jgi:hypothetical protein
MNSFYKISLVFGVFFSVVSSTSICSEQFYGSHVIFAAFTHEAPTRDSSADRVHSDFSHGHRQSDFGGHGLSGRVNNFEKYTTQDFQYHFEQSGYTEKEILHQRFLYMHDAFVKYAQTYSGYKDAIQKLYSELRNLSRMQKAYCFAKGTYCKGLQDRIAYLYKQINTATTIKPSSGSNIAKSEPAVFTEQFAEYKTLESTYAAYTNCLAKAINKRSAICHNIERTNKSYNLNGNIKKILSHYGHELVPFTHCSGNQLQQVIHQESLDICRMIRFYMIIKKH